MKRTFLLLLLAEAGAHFGCASAPVEPANEQEKKYLATINTFRDDGVFEAAEASDAWARTGSWIAKHSSMKIQTSNDYVIETYNPQIMQVSGFGEAYFGYKVVKTPLPGGKVQIEASCSMHGGPGSKGGCWRNTRVLAYYIRTGEVIPKFIDK